MLLRTLHNTVFPPLTSAHPPRRFNACSLRQLAEYGRLRRGDRSTQLGVRFNPGLGSGGTGKTNVGGPSSSFGIWHELLPDVQAARSPEIATRSRTRSHLGRASSGRAGGESRVISRDLA